MLDARPVRQFDPSAGSMQRERDGNNERAGLLLSDYEENEEGIGGNSHWLFDRICWGALRYLFNLAYIVLRRDWILERYGGNTCHDRLLIFLTRDRLLRNLSGTGVNLWHLRPRGSCSNRLSY